MKKLYSVILLFAFLVGTLQPILPMIEYQLHGGSIIQLLGHTKDDSGKVDTPVTISSSDQTSTHSADEDQPLLNDNFYPLGIANFAMPPMIVFPHTNRLFLPSTKHINSPVFLPIPPPPRLS